ncbi:hypothetical protein SAMN05518669_1057 [Variovorax sp. YR634]|uniref:hypothetical protein n=1 Tax=Variovorax sp. YR752 TaxID=1884383 RepID=UPI00089683F6|nr:hypothetical protein SAMN05518669_1057 [Variovorax sp. YR634]SOD28521.1 hypothetical protein SAMN05518800_4098 [Variovorax sp. YR752]
MATFRGLDLDEARLAGPLMRKDVVADPVTEATGFSSPRLPGRIATCQVGPTASDRLRTP